MPTPNPNDLAAVVGRVEPSAADKLAFLASLIEGHYAADSGELCIAREIQPKAFGVMREVLAALATAHAESARLREENDRLRAGRSLVEDAIERASNWQHYARDWWDEDGAFHKIITPALDQLFDAARRPITETP